MNPKLVNDRCHSVAKSYYQHSAVMSVFTPSYTWIASNSVSVYRQACSGFRMSQEVGTLRTPSWDHRWGSDHTHSEDGISSFAVGCSASYCHCWCWSCQCCFGRPASLSWLSAGRSCSTETDLQTAASMDDVRRSYCQRLLVRYRHWPSGRCRGSYPVRISIDYLCRSSVHHHFFCSC